MLFAVRFYECSFHLLGLSLEFCTVQYSMLLWRSLLSIFLSRSRLEPRSGWNFAFRWFLRPVSCFPRTHVPTVFVPVEVRLVGVDCIWFFHRLSLGPDVEHHRTRRYRDYLPGCDILWSALPFDIFAMIFRYACSYPFGAQRIARSDSQARFNHALELMLFARFRFNSIFILTLLRHYVPANWRIPKSYIFDIRRGSVIIAVHYFSGQGSRILHAVPI